MTADKLVEEVPAYKGENIIAAVGEASRFLAQFDGYSQNPAAHREKLYLEFVKTLFPTLGEIRVAKSRDGRQPLSDPGNFPLARQ